MRDSIVRLMRHRIASRLLFGLVFLSAVSLSGSLCAQEPELIVEIEKREIYEGESVRYAVTLNHVDNPTAPALTGLEDFYVVDLGEQSLNSQQITIINGRRTEIIHRGMQYNYRLTPKQSGVFTIPAPTVKVGSDVLTGRAVTLQVVAPENQDTVILTLDVDRESVYPMQPFELSLTIAVKELPGELRDKDPLSVQPTPPALRFPCLTDDEIVDGIRPAKSWRELLEPLVSRNASGVQINNVGSQSVFSLFDRQATGFHPTPERMIRKNDEGEAVGYWEYQFRRLMIPQKIGSYQFGPATLKGSFADGIEQGRLVGREIYSVAKSLSVTVKDVPLDGRPDSYIGAIGNFEVRAALAPTAASVGDPMTLTVTLTGQGTLAESRPPEISSLPEVADAFRMYEATEETTANSRRFTYSLRPLSTSVTEFPAIPISFFDVQTEKYVTRMTEPIAVSIREAETFSGADIVSSPNEAANRSDEIIASEGGLFANDSSLSSLRNESVEPTRWGILWGGMIFAWLAASAGIKRVRHIREDPALRRRRSAVARVNAALADAAFLVQSGKRSETCVAIRRAVAGLIGDYANVADAGLTPRDAADHLVMLGIDGALRNRTVALLNDCDAARYGAAADDLSSLHSEALEVVDLLVVELRKLPAAGRSAAGFAATVMLLVFSVFVEGCGAAPDLEISRKFQEAEQAFADASSNDEFARAARLNEQIGSAGFVSGAVLYNQGNAWMKAGEAGRAIASYRQAQRFRPRDPYLEANLKNALTASESLADVLPETGVAGFVFFWQNWLSYPEKFVVTTALLATSLMLSLLAQLLGGRLWLPRCSAAVGVLAVIFVASTAWDWQRYDLTVYGVVASETAVARKGNAESYETAFREPLGRGTEFVVEESRNGWVRAHVGDAGAGWLSERDVVVY